MPLFPSKKKRSHPRPIGGHVTEEEYFEHDVNGSNSTSNGKSKVPAINQANNVTEEDYIDSEPDEKALQGVGEASRTVPKSKRSIVGLGNGVAKQAEQKGSFWKRAVSRGKKKTKQPAIGAVTEEEYIELESAASGSGRLDETALETDSGVLNLATYSDGVILEDPVEAAAGLENDPAGGQDDSVRGESAYETLVLKESAKQESAQMHSGASNVRSVEWFGPGIDAPIEQHAHDLRFAMLPRRPRYVPEPWDPEKASPFLDFGPIDKVAIRLRILPGGTDCPPVVFKKDGKRFRDLQHTDTCLKLRSDMDYFIGLKLSPPVLLRSTSADLQIFSSLMGENSGTLHEVGKLALTPTLEGYCAHWRSELPVSQKSDRRRMFLKLDVEGIGWVELPLLAKIYSEDDRGSSTSGQPLGALLYRCRAHPGHVEEAEVYSVDILDCPWDMSDRSKWRKPPHAAHPY